MKKAIIIGSGIAGIASALRLKAKGIDVTVFEASDSVGGKLGVLKKKGYRWDTGPSLFTMPHLVEELFSLFNRDYKDFFSYKKKETVCNYFWEDGSTFRAKQDIDQFIQDASEEFDEKDHKIRAYLKNSLKKYNSTAPIFLDKSLHKFKTYLSHDTLKAISNFKSLDINKNLNEVNENYFNNKRLVQFFNRFATYNGSSPFQTPGIMSMIPSLEMHFGTYFPNNGMRSIIDSMYELALKEGVKFNLNEKVEAINHSKNQVNGIQTKKSTYKADFVISNMDVFYTYHHLLKGVELPKRRVNQERSSSAIIFYWGVKREFSELDLHNIFFSDNYEEEFSHIFNKKKVYSDPTVYINISSKENSSDAPNGSENWFVMVNVPSNIGQNWDDIIEQTKGNVKKKLSRLLKVNIDTLIETETILDPIKIENSTSSYQGALYGSSSNTKFAAFLRHPNFSKKFKNLLFCGGSVHPGGGIPLCLKSAKIVADNIQ